MSKTAKKSKKSGKNIKKSTKTAAPVKSAKVSAGSGKNDVLKKSKDVLSRKNPDGSFSLLNLENDSHFYSIDGIAAEFWALIDGRKSVDAIKTSLLSKFKQPTDQFDRDVKKLLTSLKKEKLLE